MMMQSKVREPDVGREDEAVDDRPGSRGRDSWVLRAVLVLLVVAVGAVVALGVRADGRADRLEQGEQQREAAAVRAEEGMRLLVGIDGASGDENLAELATWATGDFAAQLETLADTVAGVLAQGEVVSKGDVAAVGVERLRGERATVLVAATALVTNSELPNGELRTYRMVVTLDRVDDDWKIAEVEFLG
jgi:Mce-associated membrane protein